MRITRSIPFLMAFTLSFSPSVLAAGSDVDFDQGADSTGIIEQAGTQGKMRRARPLDPLMSPKSHSPAMMALGVDKAGLHSVPKNEAEKSGAAKGRLDLPSTVGCDTMKPSDDDPGGGTPSLCKKEGEPERAVTKEISAFAPVTGPYEPLPRDSKEYWDSAALRDNLAGGEALLPVEIRDRITHLGSVPPPIRDPLLFRWNGLNRIRTNLIASARPLDSDDELLYKFAVRLNTWSANIRSRRSVMDGHAATYNRLCLGRPLPEDEFHQCEAYRIRFNNCVTSHNASVTEHDRLVGVWQDNRQCMVDRGRTFREKVRDWINDVIMPWINDATKAIENGCDKLISVTAVATPSIILPRKSSVLKAEPKYASEVKPCPTEFKWSPDQPTRLGALNDFRKQTVVFTSFGLRGKQDYRVEATDDFGTKVAGTIVAIEGGKLCSVNRSYNRVDDKTTCSYQCSTPTSDIILPGDVPCPQIFDPE